MLRTAEEWIRAYQMKGALWLHDGSPKKPHAELASGKHSNGFFNSRLVIADEPLLADAAHDLVELFWFEEKLADAQVVVGPQTGATMLAGLIARRLSHLSQRACLTASPAKDADGKPNVFTPAEHGFLKGMYSLFCEDVITTGGSIRHTVEAVEKAGGIPLRYVLTLVNRSGASRIDGRKIVALIDRPMPMWTPDDCPLCKGGSEAIRPKDNWARLTA